MEYSHKPVMLREVLKYLQPQPGQKFVDCTLGGAGYTIALAEIAGKDGLVVGIDLDKLALDNAAKLIQDKKLDNVRLINDNFKNLESIVRDNFPEIGQVDGIVMDLGLSSAQLDDEGRGFSFKGDRPLDMAFGPINERSTAEIVNTYSLPELTRIFQEYGEERQAYRIAQAIVAGRREKQIETTGELIAIIERVVRPSFRSRIHPATKVFQALRMETNDELAVLSAALTAAAKILKPGGRLVVVSFHSGEDRIVKRYFRDNPGWEILTKRPETPAEVELDDNPRARSAKLRAAIKI